MNNIEIEQHAIDEYGERILNKQGDEFTDDMHMVARLEIINAVTSPDLIYHGKKDMPQIHVYGNFAIPVGVRGEEEWETMPYESLDDELVVKTVYPAQTFTKKLNNGSKANSA